MNVKGMEQEENEAKKRLQEMADSNIEQVCELLHSRERDVQEYLAHFVASLCDVDYETMVGNKACDTKTYYIAQCRYLFWYAYRYMTNEPYEKMAERLGKLGRKFSATGIISGVNKMAQMTEKDSIWKNRWLTLKRLIRMYNDTTTTTIPQFEEPSVVRMVVYKPSNVTVEVEFKNI